MVISGYSGPTTARHRSSDPDSRSTDHVDVTARRLPALEARAGDDRATPDDLLHTRTGTDVSPEDLVLAAGRDVTPQNLEWARRKLADEGPAALDKLLP